MSLSSSVGGSFGTFCRVVYLIFIRRNGAYKGSSVLALVLQSVLSENTPFRRVDSFLVRILAITILCCAGVGID